MDIKPKDVCSYKIYLKEPTTAYAQTVLASLTEIAKPWIESYIWHNEPFSIERYDSSLQGSFCFGDCIEDEWFVVWILRALSQRFPDIFISITDSDGEFLLIESAMHLPRWLDPDAAENRAWIVAGELVIIPAEPAEIKARQCPPLSLDNAINHLKNAGPLLHHAEIQADAFARIRDYPEQSKKEMHRVLCKLPRTTATILHRDPQIVAKACNALFCKGTEDNVKLQQLPKNHDQVIVVVKLTRTMYAQIKGMRFTPPPSYDGGDTDEPTQTGCKIACGLELALNDQTIRARADGSLSKGLLSDAEIATLPVDTDSDAYLSVNFEDLEKALGKEEPLQYGSFGDAELRKTVDQMRHFVTDDISGFEGAELDGTSTGTYSASEDDDGFDSEDEGFAGGGQDFMAFLRSSVANKDALAAMQYATQRQQDKFQEEADTSEEDIPDMKTYMAEMDAELRQTPGRSHDAKGKAKAVDKAEEDDLDSLDNLSEADEDLRLDFNLARNMLESMRADGGMSGPAANLLASLGVTMPRDDNVGSES